VGEPIRVAVLISGSLRTFHIVWPKNQKILDKLNLDLSFFLHTWDMNYDTHKNLMTGIDTKMVWKFWRPVELLQKPPEAIYPLKISDSKWKIKIENFDEFKSNIERYLPRNHKDGEEKFYNTLAMYYGMQQVAEMLQKERKSFDFFLRIRPDFLLPKNFSLDKNAFLKMYGQGVSIKGNLISDQCFSGLLPDSILSMFAYNMLTKKIVLEGWYRANDNLIRTGENVLFEHLSEQNFLKLLVNNKFEKKGVLIRRKNFSKLENKKIFDFAQEVFKYNKHIIYKKTIRHSTNLMYFFRSKI